MADTPEQLAYDEELATIEAMPTGAARMKAMDAFNQKYPQGRPGKTPAQKALEAEAAGKAFGFMKQFLDQYPDDNNLQLAWARLLDNDIAGAKLAFQASKYYQNTSSTSDSRLKRKLSQFGVYTQELNSWMDTQARRLVQAGITIDLNNTKVREILETAYLNGDSDNQVDIKALAFLSGKLVGGQTGASVSDMFAGRTTYFDIQSKIRQDSASAFPVYSDQILNGVSVDSIGSAYKNSFANILELDPDAVDWNEPVLRKAMQYTKDGKPSTMPLWMFEDELRKDPRWQYTNNARESVYNAIYQVGTDFGVL